jgi:3-hydroxyisobutyrate dehydrogenase-like beta-hydroxyacid dehydrogenase
MNSSIQRVGIVGLGKMGLPMASHLQKRGFTVSGCDRDPSRKQSAERAGIRFANSARELASSTDFVIIVVGFDAEVEEVLLGSDGVVAGACSGLIVGVASTVAPRTMQRISRSLEGTGVALLDMPITRGEPAAAAGNLLVMVGGDELAYARCKPALEAFATSIYHLGDLGAGQVAKMVNNLILWACISANYEGFRLAESLGVDRERLRTALLQSSASNWALETRPEEQPMPWAEKDMRIVLSEADRLRLSVPLCGVLTEVVKSVKIERGWPTPDVESSRL